MMIRYVAVATPYGSAGIVASRHRLSNVLLSQQTVRRLEHELGDMYPKAYYDPHLLEGLQHQLRDYFAGRPVRFRVSPDLSGLTDFQRRVLDACRQIGYGETTTYGKLAWSIGRPRAARAVGGALARNPVPLVIPCHRVIAGDGSLGGFSAPQGIRLKRQLLELETKVMARSR